MSEELARPLSPALFARAETVIWITELERKLFHGEISSDLGFGWLQVLHPIRRVRDDFKRGMKARRFLHHRPTEQYFCSDKRIASSMAAASISNPLTT